MHDMPAILFGAAAAALLYIVTMNLLPADANVDLGGGKTRFDIAEERCLQLPEEVRDEISVAILRDGRIVFMRNCGWVNDQGPPATDGSTMRVDELPHVLYVVPL